MIDSHTHLHLCEPPDEDLVADAARAGITRMLSVATDPAGCTAALAAAAAYPSVYAAVGCHPNNAELLDEAQLRRDAAGARCVAIGETGLDYYRDHAPREAQRAAFECQVALARELDLALVVHSRDATDDTLAVLHEQAAGLRVIIHCFSMPERLEECLAAGWWISFAGNVTYRNNEALAAASELVPDERLLVETDAPFLAPQSRRGHPNSPALVCETARFIAQRRGVPYEDLDTRLEASARAAFAW